MTCAALLDFICLTRPQLCHWICRTHLRFLVINDFNHKHTKGRWTARGVTHFVFRFKKRGGVDFLLLEGSTLTISIWHFRLFKAVLMHFLKELGKTCPPGWNKFPTFSRTSDWVTPHFHYSLKEARTDISLLGLGWNTWERQRCSSLENPTLQT